MQWFILIIWSLWVASCVRLRKLLLCRITLALGLIIAMLGQLALLHMDGLLTFETALPLHLCGLFGVLSIPLLFHPFPPLWDASVFLAAPAASCALFFPAVISCSHPVLMRLAFYQLHALLVLVPVFWIRTGKPLPTNARRTFLLGSGYLLFIWAFNNAFGTNYLFTRSAPSGTPLEWLLKRGEMFYLCSLMMLCMPLFSCMQGLFCRFNQRRVRLTAGNSSSCNRCSRYTPPWSSPNRG